MRLFRLKPHAEPWPGGKLTVKGAQSASP